MSTPEQQPHTTSGPEPGSDAGMADLERDIEQTREALGETIEELAQKFDDARSRARSASTAGRDLAQDQPAMATAIGAGALAAAALVGLLVWRRRR